jgi:asparagine synthase (glutamine-hydrolysing)
MCGIAGIVQLSPDGPPPPLHALDVLLDAQAHRGPDDEGRFADGPVALGCRRLALVDPLGGAQPLASEDGAVQVVANGELYDDARERRTLEARGHRFRTGSDCEIFAHRYEERGAGFTADLRGMWAAGLWDARERRLILARDPFGIKPLVYARVGDMLVFASELGALLRLTEVPRDLDPVAVDELLAWGAVLGDRTIVRAVRRVPPGTLLIAEDGDVRLVRVARPAPAHATALRTDSAANLATELRVRLQRSVRVHLRGDAEVGVLLSGGIDSGAICALAATETGPGLPTFTVGFPSEPTFDERGPARRIASRYATDHHELVVAPADAEIHLAEVAASFDEPRADATALPYWLARLQDVDLGTFCGDDLLCQADRAGMAHGVEVRVPFLDAEIAELAHALPARHRVRGLRTKPLLRRAVAPLLPRDVVRGPKKGFVAPAAAWLRGPLLPFAREVLAAGTVERQGLVRHDAVAALLDRHVARREDLSRPLWGLMALTLWYDAHLTRAPSRRPLEVR